MKSDHKWVEDYKVEYIEKRCLDTVDDIMDKKALKFQDSSGVYSVIYWNSVVDLSSIMVSNKFQFGCKSNVYICHEEDDFNCILIETFDTSNINQALPKSTQNRFKDAYILHVYSNPVSCVKDLTVKLKSLLQQHLK